MSTPPPAPANGLHRLIDRVGYLVGCLLAVALGYVDLRTGRALSEATDLTFMLAGLTGLGVAGFTGIPRF